MPCTSHTAAGVGGMFNFALNAAPRNFFTGTVSTHPVTVALVNWPEFRTGGVQPPPRGQYSNCSVLEKPNATTNVCPTGTVEADVINGCHGVDATCAAEAYGTVPAGPGCFLMRSTAVGTYTFGLKSEVPLLLCGQHMGRMVLASTLRHGPI